jgi:prophage maintenance system killer protein
MIVALSYELLVLTNREYGGPGAGVRDESGLRSALARPFATFLDTEPYPGTFPKAASLLHGLATTQYFFDGNKRTAFLAATAFLELNGVYLGEIDPILSESFTLSVAAKLLDIPRIVEWFEAMHDRRQRGATIDPRFEYLALAQDVVHDSGVIHVRGAHLQGITVATATHPSPPYVFQLVVYGRIHWREEDTHQGHVITVSLVPTDAAATRKPRRNNGRHEMQPPGKGGHEHHPNGVMPTLISMGIEPQLYDIGQYVVLVRLDGKLAGEIPFKVSAMAPIPDYFVEDIN